MSGNRTRFALLAAVLAAGLGVVVAVTAADERGVIKVETHPDGSRDVYLAHSDGEIVIEHQDASGEIWFESNEVIGLDGEPIICPNGEPLRIDVDARPAEPTPAEAAAANRNLPEGKMAAFNEYTGEFQVVNGAVYDHGDGQVIVKEPLVYKCGADNNPTLVPLSEVDPDAAEAAKREMERLLKISDEVTGLGADPAATDPQFRR